MHESEFNEDIIFTEDDYSDEEMYEEIYVDLSEYPSATVALEDIQYGIFISDVLIKCGFATDIIHAYELISAGMISVNDEEVSTTGCILTEEDFYEGYVVVEKYPEEYCSIVIDL